jgi:copper(I)-binding protein
MMRVVRLAVAVLAAAVPFASLAQLKASEPWVRGTVAGQRATGAFMKLATADDVTLIAASSPVATSVEIHEMKMEGGTMKMRAIERLPVPKGRGVELSPGGYHLMLIGLTKPLGGSEQVPISLTFEDRAGKRSTLDVVAPVRALGSSPSTPHGGMKH